MGSKPGVSATDRRARRARRTGCENWKGTSYYKVCLSKPGLNAADRRTGCENWKGTSYYKVCLSKPGVSATDRRARRTGCENWKGTSYYKVCLSKPGDFDSLIAADN